MPNKLDANDLRKQWLKTEMPEDEQRARIQGMMATAQPLIERMAEAAGTMRDGLDEDDTWSAEYEKAVDAVVAQMLQLDEKTQGRYKNKMARKLRIPIRDFNNALAGKKRDAKKKKEDEIPVVETLGGWFRNGDGLYFVETFLDYEAKELWLAWRDPQGNIKTGQELFVNNGYMLKLVPVNKEEFPIVPGIGNESASVVMPPGVHPEPVTLSECLQESADFMKHEYLFDEERTPFIIGIQIINSWTYDNFRSLAYTRAIGDRGSGKSELMRRMGHLCYRLTKASGGDTESTFFRMTEATRGTIFTEEADLEKSSASNNIVKFYNLGAMDGNFVNRSEEWINPRTGVKTFRVKNFPTFCPKLFAMRGEYADNAVKSRSLDIHLVGKSSAELKEAGIELEMGSRYWARWRKLVPKLLRLRMQMAEPEKIDLGLKLVDVNVDARYNQVTLPIKLLAEKAGDKTLLGYIEKMLREKYAEETAEKSMETEARVVEALWKMYVYPDLRERLVVRDDGEILVKIGEVTAITNNIIEEMKAEGQDLRTAKPEGEQTKKKSFEVGPQRVGHIMRDVIQLKRLEQRANKGFFCVWDDVKMEIAGRKYGVLPEEAQIMEARKAMAAKRAKVDLSRKPLQMTIEMKSEMDEGPDEPPDWHMDEPEPVFDQ